MNTEKELAGFRNFFTDTDITYAGGEAMTPTEKDALNREFAELVGISPYESVFGNGDGVGKRPIDFAADPRLVLREMKQRKDWGKFVFVVGEWPGAWTTQGSIVCYILDTTGKLRDKAIEFMKEVRP